jgi:mono/diheme cytochrome c family protein
MKRFFRISGVVTLTLLILITGVFFVSTVYADDSSLLAEGKKLFEWKAPNGRSCSGCHENGKLLENTANKKYWTMMGVKFRHVEDVINMCRENPMGLNSPKFAPGSKEMEALKAYVFSFSKSK